MEEMKQIIELIQSLGGEAKEAFVLWLIYKLTSLAIAWGAIFGLLYLASKVTMRLVDSLSKPTSFFKEMYKRLTGRNHVGAIMTEEVNELQYRLDLLFAAVEAAKADRNGYAKAKK